MRIAGAGCSLADFVYSGIDFTSPAFRRFLSREPGDGGLEPGKLVFLEEFEKFAGRDLERVVRELAGERPPDTFNVGGPCVVALILASQLLAPCPHHQTLSRFLGAPTSSSAVSSAEKARELPTRTSALPGAGGACAAEVAYYGVMGDDWVGERLRRILSKMPLNIDHYRTIHGSTPFTTVFSDPSYAGGHGERTFINNIGASWHIGPSDLPDSFYASDIVLFGATGIVPQLHDHLTELVARGREKGCVTAVSTVFDFRNEKANPGGAWPLGDTPETLRRTDLLITDCEEALRIAGAETVEEACRRFMDSGVSSFAITQGAEPVYYYSNGALFRERKLATLPISAEIARRRAANPDLRGDTTGCGDNFVGGVLASLAMQMSKGEKGGLDMPRAVATGICAGGCACFHLGGAYVERRPGEKAGLIGDLYDKYRAQVRGQAQLPPIE